jgi:1-acyl-sn-glycerol-3-phosphate acyltransferase
MTLNLLRKIVHFLFNVIARVEIRGLENLPASGGVLICTNHLSIIDPALVFVFGGRDCSALVASKHKKNPFLRWIVNVVGGIWLERGEADLHALRAAQEYLNNGGALGIAPEGTRSKTHGLIEAKTGAAYLAEKTGVIVAPVGITGSDMVVSSWKRLRRPRLVMTIGKPFHLPPVVRATRSADLQRNTDEIMCQIAALLPAHQRGVYANHPRLAALLAESTETSAFTV